jgi:glycosyltransferase involved in cell wall biosynthesis
MTLPAYTVVVATYERPDDLARLLESLAAQSWRPAEVVIVDASPGPKTAEIAQAWTARLPIRYARAEQPSAARQRNQGARGITTPLLAFVDDDAIIPSDSLAKIGAAFAADPDERTGGIAARIEGMQHRAPSGWLRRYYRCQAGFEHPTYGGKLFGPGLNCLPTYDEPGGELIPSDWLNSTCVFYRTPLFARERFPEFEGYSFLEDVHLSSRVGRTHRLFFHREARFIHNDAPSTFKRHRRALARMRLRHQRVVAREILGLRGPALTLKLLLHRLFVSAVLLRQREPGWREAFIGTWT